MTKRKLFPGTSLDKKIPKKADPQTTRKENFVYLCEFFGLDTNALLAAPDGPWKTLAERLMEHVVPGFQITKSGRQQKFTEYSDYEDVQIVERLAALKFLYTEGTSKGQNGVITPEKLRELDQNLNGSVTSKLTPIEFENFLDNGGGEILYETAAKVLTRQQGLKQPIRADQVRSRHDNFKRLSKRKAPNLLSGGLWQPFVFEAGEKKVNPNRYANKKREK